MFSITQNGHKSQKPGRRDPAVCTYCDEPAAMWDGMLIQPPMCLPHFDLSILVEFVRSHKQPLTVENIQAQLTRARANSNQWVLTVDQVPALLPDLVPELAEAADPQPAAEPQPATEGG